MKDTFLPEFPNWATSLLLQRGHFKGHAMHAWPAGSTIGIGVVLLGRPPDGRRYPDFALVALILLASLASAYNTAIICEHGLCRKYSIFRCCV